MSLFLVDADTPGFHKGRKLNKLGLKGQDTAELFFEDVRVPASALLGQVSQNYQGILRIFVFFGLKKRNPLSFSHERFSSSDFYVLEIGGVSGQS